jgi:hypothetical protein
MGTVSGDTVRARQILRACQEQHGAEAFRKIQDIAVSYEGRWGRVGPLFQPVLVDKGVRRASEERLLPKQRIIWQQHQGPRGGKQVLRTQDDVKVKYSDPTLNVTEEIRAAAALVADAYQLFLLGPHFVNQYATSVTYRGQEKVAGERCDVLLAVIRPGWGRTQEDRVLLSISASNKQLRRVRMTLTGVETTQGAEVDVTYLQYRRYQGVLWPVDYNERIRAPFDLQAHRWQLKGLDLNRGLSLSQLQAAGPAVTRPASPLPVMKQ